MSGVNKAIVIGHLGGDPKITHSQNGAPIASFSVATSETWRDKQSGERKERTQWHRIVIFNEALCKVAEQYLKKGSKVFIEGQMETRKWVDQGGIERYVTEIILRAFGSSLVLLDKRDGGVPPNDGGGEDHGRSRGAAATSSTKSDMDDEIPF